MERDDLDVAVLYTDDMHAFTRYFEEQQQICSAYLILEIHDHAFMYTFGTPMGIAAPVLDFKDTYDYLCFPMPVNVDARYIRDELLRDDVFSLVHAVIAGANLLAYEQAALFDNHGKRAVARLRTHILAHSQRISSTIPGVGGTMFTGDFIHRVFSGDEDAFVTEFSALKRPVVDVCSDVVDFAKLFNVRPVEVESYIRSFEPA